MELFQKNGGWLVLVDDGGMEFLSPCGEQDVSKLFDVKTRFPRLLANHQIKTRSVSQS